VALAFLTSMAGSIGFITAYQLDAGTQWLAVALVVALGGLGVGLVWWSRRLMPQSDASEPRPVLVPPVAEEERTAATFEEGRRSVGRRGLLGSLLAGALGAFGLGALWPVRSLGPRPAIGLRETGWADGVHLVDEAGRRIPADALDPGGILTVFPEGRDPAADDQVVLLRIEVGDLLLPAEREGWTPDGYVAYSKVCTHAGCPVGLYQNVGYLLLCPCHQATFDVARAAVPVFGPAARALPQLPLRIGDDDTLVAAGPFSGPVGPDRWRLGGEAGDEGPASA
jgi:ubiquinol-cytochrome c reductase iron-sulfur subunit